MFAFAFVLAACVPLVAAGGLLALALPVDVGRHRAGRRVRSRRTAVSSRGQRPFRGGKVRM